MLSDILYYFVYASAVLLYGVGLDRVVVLSPKPSHGVLACLKMLLSVSASSAISYLINCYLLVPVHLTDLAPFFAVLVFVLIAVFIEIIIRISAKNSVAECCVSFLCVLLGLTEGSSIASCVIISCVAVVIFYLFVPVLFAIRRRIKLSPLPRAFRNESVIFISIAIIMIMLLAWNVSWLNPGVLK